MGKTLTAKTILATIAMDVVFIPVVALWYFELLGLGCTRTAVMALVGFAVLRAGIGASHMRAQLRPYELCVNARHSERTASMVLLADEATQRSATRISILFATSWATMFSLTALVVRFGTGATPGVSFTSGFWGIFAVAFAGIWCGGFCAVAPVIALLTDPAAGECSSMAPELGVSLARVPQSMQSRIGVVAFFLALGPTMCFIAVGYAKQVDNHEQQNRAQAGLYLMRVVERFDRRLEPEEQRRALVDIQGAAPGVELEMIDRHGQSLFRVPEIAVVTSIGPSEVRQRTKTAMRGVLRDSSSAAAIAFQRLDGDVTAIASVDVPTKAGEYVLGVSILALVISLWAPFCALLLGRAITKPIERLIGTTERIVNEGKQSEISALPVVRNDEVGRLSARFNDLIEMMRDLSRAADAIANGALYVHVSRQGELPDAFRRMLDGLRSMVREMRGTSVELASAATEILAASQEQEAATASQSSAMEEINRTMDSLAASAAHVSDSVQGVVAVTQQQRSGTEQVSESIRNITGLVTQSVSATAQIRTSAQGLKGQADRLAGLVKRFELESAGVS